MRAGQSAVEVPHLPVVVQQRAQRPGQPGPVAGVGVRPVPAVRVLAEEPAGPGGEVGGDGGEAERRRRAGQVAGGGGDRALRPGGPARAEVPQHRQQREAGQEPDPAPLHAAGQPEQDAAAEAPRPGAEPGGPGGQPLPHPVPVENQAAEAGQHEQREEDVEQGEAALHDGQPVDGEQQAGDAAEQGGAGHPADHPDEDQHAQGAGDRGRHPPADRPVAEDPDPRRDQPLPERRVHDEHVAGVVLVALAQQLHALGGVVDLVELLLRREADPPQPDGGGDERDDPGGHPGQRLVGRHPGQPRQGRAGAAPPRLPGRTRGVECWRLQRRGHARDGMWRRWAPPSARSCARRADADRRPR